MYVCQVTLLNTPRIMLQTTDHDELFSFSISHFKPISLRIQTYVNTKYITSYVWRNKEVRSSSFVIFCPSVYYASPRFLKRQFIIFKRRIVVFCQLTSYKISRLFYFFWWMKNHEVHNKLNSLKIWR